MYAKRLYQYNLLLEIVAAFCVAVAEFVYLFEMEIPAKVREAARDLIERYGDRLVYLGEYHGAQAYYYRFPDDLDTGFPFVYLLKGESVSNINGFDALDIIRLFVKDDGNC